MKIAFSIFLYPAISLALNYQTCKLPHNGRKFFSDLRSCNLNGPGDLARTLDCLIGLPIERMVKRPA